MPVQRPKYFGFEGQCYWDNLNLFQPDLAAEKVSDAAVQAWLLAAEQSDAITDVFFAWERERRDITSRAMALQGFAKDRMLVGRVMINFRLFHQRDDPAGILIQAILGAANTNTEIALAFMDNSATEREGFLGNFDVSLSGQQPLRGIQSWEVTAVPRSYINYWQEPAGP